MSILYFATLTVLLHYRNEFFFLCCFKAAIYIYIKLCGCVIHTYAVMLHAFILKLCGCVIHTYAFVLYTL